MQVRLTNGPIVNPQTFPPEGIEVAGAVVMFRGVVRPNESARPNEKAADDDERPIAGLKYEVYEPMTSLELTRLAETQATKHGVIAVDVEHSVGLVAAGECSFVLQVAGKHRGEAIRLMDEFIVEMKRHVPIWKVPVSKPDPT